MAVHTLRMTAAPQNKDLLYGLNDKPGVAQCIAAAVQHVLASFVGIITPTLVIGFALGLQSEIPYLISMALFVSGVSTFIQVKTFGPIGCGLVAVQGTSFAFLGSILAAGGIAKARGGGPDDIIALIIGVCFFGAFVEIFLSQFVARLRRILTPLVTGIVITTIGLSLIKVAMTDMAGGFGSDDFGSPVNLALSGGVLSIIIAVSASNNAWLRLSAIIIGMLVGCIAAWFTIGLSFEHLIGLPVLAVPQPFKYGFAFDWGAFIPIAIIYLLTTLETSGDLTANSLFCQLPVSGPEHRKRLEGGILADGINSLIAATLNTFPNTTFGQNNAVIQMTGVASRRVGYYVAGLLALLGLFPIVGGLVQAMPKPVLGGATLIMFGTIAAAGIKIIASETLDRRKILITATSFGLSLGLMMVPEVLNQAPTIIQSIFGSTVSTAGLTAIIMVLLIPENSVTEDKQ
jgi:xanthine permease XanP